MSDWTIGQEAIKAAFSAGVSVFTLGLGWLVGQRLSAVWALRQKQRELDLSAATEFSRLYGEFFAIWKLWNHLCRSAAQQETNDIHWSLMQRAVLMEAGFEALLVRVCSDRVLDIETLQALGLLRQAFQHLRECMRENKAVVWSYSEHPQYLALKQRACFFSRLLTSERHWKTPDSNAVASALQQITSNEHEQKWEALVGRVD